MGYLRKALTAGLLSLCVALTTTAQAEGELRLDMSCPSEAYVGEPVDVLVTVTNTSKSEVFLPHAAHWGNRERFTLFAKRPDKVTELNPFHSWVGYSGEAGVELRPGETYQATFRLPWVGVLLEPLTMEMVGVFQSEGFYYGTLAQFNREKCWQGEVTSAPVKLRLRHPETTYDQEALEILAGPHFTVDSFPRLFEYVPKKTASGSDNRFMQVLEKYPDSVYAKHCEYALGCAYAILYMKHIVRDDYERARAAEELEKAKLYLERCIARKDFQFRPDAELCLARCLARKSKDPKDDKASKDKALALLRDAAQSKSRPITAEAANREISEMEWNEGSNKE